MFLATSRGWSPQTRLLVLLTLLLAILAAPVTARAANPAETLGVYSGSSADAVGVFESKLGRPVNVVHDAFSRDTWKGLINIDWFLDQWRPTRYAPSVVFTVGMLPNSGGSLAEGATGAYNEHWRTFAERMVAGGQGSAVVRLGGEFNGDWFRWSIKVRNGGRDYAAYWRQVVDTMRSVDGANFRFDWCPNAGGAYVDGKQLDAETAWPGDKYVDFVGLDLYDQSWAPDGDDPVARWNEFRNLTNGLNWHRSFSAAHDKPMTYPEWGLAHREDAYGGGDDPYFIERMYDWIRTNDVAYHMYFDFSDGTIDSALFGGRFPKASRRFVELFGAGSTGGPLRGTPERGPAASGPRYAVEGAPSLTVKRGRILRDERRLQVVAAIAGRSSGTVRVTLAAAGRRTRYAARIRASGRARLSRRIPGAQAVARRAIVTVTHGRERIRLRASAR